MRTIDNAKASDEVISGACSKPVVAGQDIEVVEGVRIPVLCPAYFRYSELSRVGDPAAPCSLGFLRKVGSNRRAGRVEVANNASH